MGSPRPARLVTPFSLPAGVQRFGKYFLVEKIGAGGMAEVFRAVTAGPEGFQRVLVVKRILPSLSRDPGFVRMFVDEAKITALLSHPNVVQVHEFGVVDGAYFLAMEHVHGRDLATIFGLLKERLLAPSIAADIARQVGLGLDYAHRLAGPGGRPLGIIHRDVSPANVMLSFNGAVKLLDFGLSHAVRDAADDGTVRGKVSYMAPEQLRPGPIDHRADIFGLGAVLHEALTGKRLFLGANDLETVRIVLQKPIPAPSSTNGGVSPALDRIVLRALERDPMRRYQTAGQMAADLEQCLLEARHTSQTLPRLMQTLFGEAASSSHELGVSSAVMAALTKVGEAQASPPAGVTAEIDGPPLDGGVVFGDLSMSTDRFGDYRPEAPIEVPGRSLSRTVLVALALIAGAAGAAFFALRPSGTPTAGEKPVMGDKARHTPGVIPLETPAQPEMQIPVPEMGAPVETAASRKPRERSRTPAVVADEAPPVEAEATSEPTTEVKPPATAPSAPAGDDFMLPIDEGSGAGQAEPKPKPRPKKPESRDTELEDPFAR